MKNTILYHKNCTDGIISAFLFYILFKEYNQLDETEFIPVNYNQPVPEIKGKKVFIVDFSYNEENLKKIAENADIVFMLDHHKTAADMFGGYVNKLIYSDNNIPIDIKIKEDQSGAGLVYDFIQEYLKISAHVAFSDVHSSIKINTIKNLFIAKRLKYIVDRVQDRDLWKFSLEKTQVVYEMLQMESWEFDNLYDLIFNLTNDTFDRKLQKAENYFELRESLAQEYASKSQLITFQGYENISIVNCPANFSSRVCEIMHQKNNSPFSIAWIASTSEVFVSLRSGKDGADVSEICKKYNGGGHIAAAGFKLNTIQLLELLNGKL